MASDALTRISPVGVIGAGRRLHNLGVPEEFIDADQARPARARTPSRCGRPCDGVVLERNVVDGQGFKAGDVLFRIADHSVVWMMADVPRATSMR